MIQELAVPASVTDEWIEMVRIRNEIEADSVGNYDLAIEPAELLPYWQNEHEPKRLLIARIDGRIVARAIYEKEGDSATWLAIEVLPAFRNRGIGAALYDRLVSFAREDGLDVLQGSVQQKADDSADRIPSPTGFGSVPLHAPSTRFLLARGFSLEQVERMSRLELPVLDIDRRVVEATDATGPDYDLVFWSGRTPPEHLADIALLRSRMATDAPSAGLDVDTTEWTADRVRRGDDLLETSPRTMLTVLAVHASTGAVAGFSELNVPPDASRPVSQEDTIVLREHRGHRLGMLLKVANIAYLQRELPGHPSITTFNAEENRHMLSVNEAVGFVAWGYEGEWRKEL